MNIGNNRIRLAIQKSGRLSEESFNLLRNCGIQVKPRKEQLFCHSDNFALDLLLVRDDDIPNLVLDGICDFGIVGTNLLKEQSLQSKNTELKNKVEIIQTLDFAVCRLSIALPIQFPFETIHSLNQCKIATSYPYILKEFFKRNKIQAEITTLTGAVEIAPRMGIADGICDLVSTGATLEANHLREVMVVYQSQAVLIKTKMPFTDEKQRIAEIFQNRVNGSEHANGSKYIMLHAPKKALNQIVLLLPGAECPTIMDLQGDPEKVAIHALCRENIFWETMEQLKMAGASSILVLPVEKMMK